MKLPSPSENSRNFLLADEPKDRKPPTVSAKAAPAVYLRLLREHGTDAWGPEVQLSQFDLLTACQAVLSLPERLALRDQVRDENRPPWEEKTK